MSNINNVRLDNLEEVAVVKENIPKLTKLSFLNKFRKKKKIAVKRNLKLKFILNCNLMRKKDYLEKYEKNFKNNTFYEENIDVDDWDYKSDNDEKKIVVGKKLHDEIRNINEMFIYFTESWAGFKEKKLRSMLRCDSYGNIKLKRIKKENIENLVDKYNIERVLQKNGKLKYAKKNESVLLQKTNEFMKKFIENLGVYRIYLN